jgi:hypothetical protein
MSLDQFVGPWEITVQHEGDPKKYKPGTRLEIRRDDAGTCNAAWRDEDGSPCSLSRVSYDEASNRLRGRCKGKVGAEEEVDYEVDISFLLSSATAINGEVASCKPGRNDDPLTGLWTADRRPPGGPSEGDRENR